jgi:hypothetical protein
MPRACSRGIVVSAPAEYRGRYLTSVIALIQFHATA